MAQEFNREDVDVVGGLFDTDAKAERAVQELEKVGFPRRDIGIAVREGGGAELSEVERAREQEESQPDFLSRMRRMFGGQPRSAQSPELGARLPKDRADYFVQGVGQGKILVTVQSGDRAADAERILAATGADLGAGARAASPAPAGKGEMGHQRVQLVGEALRVSKTTEPAGEVRIRKEVVEETQTVQVPVSHEEIVVERGPATGEPAERPVGEGEEVRIPLTQERAQVEKESVDKGYVDVAKKKIEEVKSFTEKLRHEKADVEGAGEEKEGEKGTPPSGRAA